MEVCICGDSARRVLERLGANDLARCELVDASDVVLVPPNWRQARELAFSVWEEFGTKASVLVRSPKDRRTHQMLDYQYWTGAIPHQSLVRLPDGTLVTTPWFDLLMDARSLSYAQVSKRIMELTSIYRIDAGSEDGFVGSPPIITRDTLEHYIMEAKGSGGAARLRKALEWSPPNARSPREVDLTLPLTMPLNLDGCGFPIPKLNHQIMLSGSARAMMGQDSAFIDLYWKGITERDGDAGAEYLGRQHHQSIGVELTRVNALASRGIDLHLIANEQLSDARQLLMVAKRIARTIGHRPRGNRWPSEGALQRLIDEILKEV